MADNLPTQEVVTSEKPKNVWLHVLGWSAFAALAYGFGVVGSGLIYRLLVAVGAPLSSDPSQTLLTMSLALYGIAILVIVGFAWWRKQKFSLKELGLTRILEWKDIGLSLAGVVLYFLLTFVALQIAALIPGFDKNQSQQIDTLGQMYGQARMIAFVALVIVSPVFEEIIFRGLIYGRLRRVQLPWWIPAAIVSALFGAAHMQWNVAVDVFCLSMVACALREVTGSIWAGILVHVMKNLLAFMVVFVFVQGVVH